MRKGSLLGPSYAHGMRSSNSDCTTFCLRHRHQIFIADLRYIYLQQLVRGVLSRDADFEVVIAQGLSPFLAAGLQRDDFQALADETFAKLPVLVHSQFSQNAI